MKDRNGKIVWSLEKKARRDQERVERELHKAQADAKLHVGKLWGAWKSSLGKTIKTHSEFTASFLRLREDIRRELVGKEMDLFLKETLAIMDGKIETLEIMAGISADQNEIVQRVPVTHLGIAPVIATIKSRQEFEAIPFVKEFMDRKDFVGFLREPGFVHAIFDPDELLVVATTLNDIGLESYLTVQAFREGLGVKNN